MIRFVYKIFRAGLRDLILRVFLIFVTFLVLGSGAGAQEVKLFEELRVNPFDQPFVFDLRESGQLSDVRTQPTGGCWSSSAMVTVESWMRTQGLGTYSLSDKNLQKFHGFDDSRNTYGNHYMATAYFSRGSGPVIKSPAMDTTESPIPQIPYILSEARYLPGDAHLIKQVLFDFGPIYSMLYFKRNAVDSSSFVLQSPENPLDHINHAVSLVGWDDTLATTEGRGAWIAQNSLGKRFGDQGFFYIPYEDPSILKHNAVWTGWDPFDESCSIHYYDTLGSFNTYGFNDSICYGLVQYNIEEECRLLRASSHINTPGTYLRFEIYEHFDSSRKVLTGLLGETEEKLCVFPGYYTLELPGEILLTRGNPVYVLAYYNAPLYDEPLPVEQEIEDYANPHLTAGKCWVNPNRDAWPDAWYECGQNTQYPALNFDLCIRIVTKRQK